MASKRTASNDLNHENWDREEETEDAGTFTKASEEVLEKRVIKTARRRVANTAGPKSAFGSFAGFKTSESTSSPFSFLSNLKPNTSTNTPTSVTPNTVKTTTSNGTLIPENGLGVAPKSPSKQSTSKMEKETPSAPSDEKSPEYYAKLKGLNESVTKWIKKHVDSSPFCILTPIFRDYEKHLNEIELKYGQEVNKESNTLETVEKKPTVENVTEPSTSTEIKIETSIFGNTSAGTMGSWKPEKSIFGNTSNTKSVFTMEPKVENKSLFSGSQDNTTFSIKPKTEETEAVETETKTPAVSFPTATFSFGQSSSTPSGAGFSFGGAKPFTFGAQVAKPEEKNDKDQTEVKEDEDEPPKVEFKTNTEEGSIFDQRCKVFVKKDGNFGDRGVGTLFLKPTSNDKMQLIVRAGNSLGNILLNFILTESIPLKRMNKNTIMLVCIPTPTTSPPPTPVLLRVKTSEEADTLMEALEKNKK